MLSQQRETDKDYHWNPHKILFKKKYIINLCNIFLGWSFFPWYSTWENRDLGKWKTKKLLGATIDKHFKFEEHIVKQCKKAGQKRSALAKVCNILNQERRRTFIKAFLESQFGYCPLIWSFAGEIWIIESIIYMKSHLE